jgi:hypothetical protein
MRVWPSLVLAIVVKVELEPYPCRDHCVLDVWHQSPVWFEKKVRRWLRRRRI